MSASPLHCRSSQPPLPRSIRSRLALPTEHSSSIFLLANIGSLALSFSMSTTVSPASDGGAAHKKTQELAAQDKVLKIDVTRKGNAPGDFRASVKQLAGACPDDQPLWLDHTETDYDARGMAPYSVRYACDREATSKMLVDNEAAVRRDIWRKLRQLLDGDGNDNGSTPAVMIDHGTRTADSSCAIVDLVFTTHKHVQKVSIELKQLELQHDDGECSRFKYSFITNSLSGDILVVECLRLPIDDASDTQALLEAFSDMAAGVGKVLGIAELVTNSKEWNVRARNGVTRVYIKIHERNMAIDWSELVHKLPTRFVWHGFPYTLRFQGSGLLKEDVFSSNYPSGADSEANEGASVVSPSKRPRTSNGEATSDSTAAKRPRSSRD